MSKVDSGRPLPPNVTPERPWTAIEACVCCGAIRTRPLTEAEFREWWREVIPEPTVCDRCRSDSR